MNHIILGWRWGKITSWKPTSWAGKSSCSLSKSFNLQFQIFPINEITWDESIVIGIQWPEELRLSLSVNSKKDRENSKDQNLWHIDKMLNQWLIGGINHCQKWQMKQDWNHSNVMIISCPFQFFRWFHFISSFYSFIICKTMALLGTFS